MKTSLLFFLFNVALLVGHGQETPPASPPPEPTAPEASKSSAAERPLRDLTADSPDAEDATNAKAEAESARSASTPPDASATPAVEANDGSSTPSAPAKPSPPDNHRTWRHHDSHNAVVQVFGDAYLDANRSADAVVAVFGNSTANGPVHGSVVAVFGDSTARQEVRESVVAVFGNARADMGAGREVVAVFGDVYINGDVDQNVVSVFGTVHLGPKAHIRGNVVSVGAEIEQEVGSRIEGEVVAAPVPVLATAGRWFRETIGLGRLLSYNPGILWPWVVAFAFLGFYVLLSLAAARPMERCAQALEQRPGSTVGTAFLCIIALPPLMVLLSFTVVGLPVLLLALFIAGLFGKAAFMVFLGRRILAPFGVNHTALAALIGGTLLLLLYTVPLLGVTMWMTSGVIGIGMVVQAIAMSSKRDRLPSPTVLPPTPGAPLPYTHPPVPVSQNPVGVVPNPNTSAGSGISSPNVSPGFASTPTAAPNLVSPGFGSTSTGETFPPPLVPPAMPFQAAPVVNQALLPRAGFWIRTLAGLIDVVVIAVLTGPTGLAEFFLFFLAAYCVVMWTLKGTTVGGTICGLKVVRLDDRKIDWSVSLVRALGSFLSLAVIGLGFIWVAFDDERQSWHDKIAGTTIVKMPRGMPLI